MAMSDGMYEAFAGKPGKKQIPREVQINKNVDVVIFKDSVLIYNKLEKTTISLKKTTLKKIIGELK
jgi:hypothetical protein